MSKLIFYNFIKYILFNLFFRFFWNQKFKLNDDYNFQVLKIQNVSLLKQLYLSNFKNIKNRSTKNHLYHSFNWIDIGRRIGGSQNITKTRNHLIDWHKKKYSNFSYVWTLKLTSERFLNLIYYYDFYSQTTNQSENKHLIDLIKLHKNILSFEFKFLKIYDPDFTSLKAILLIFIINKKNIDKIANVILKNIPNYFNNNGSHKSYNASIQLVALNNLIEIRNMFLFYKLKNFEILNISIFKAGCYLASLFHRDRTISFFNGSNNFYLDEVNRLLKKIDNIKKYKSINIEEGIALYHDNKKSIFFDAVSPGKYFEKNNLHAGTLSIEFSVNNEKIITNCGSLETGLHDRLDYLKYTAAHSTIILDNTNVSEIKGSGSFKKYPKKVQINQSDDGAYFIMDGIHDGYLLKYGILTKRKIKINKSRNEIRGTDTLISKKLIGKNKLSYSIRFHLSPDITCNMTNNKKNIIIKTKNNSVYLFESNNELSIENSIFIVDGIKTTQNKQIVMNNIVKSIKETSHWTLKSA